MEYAQKEFILQHLHPQQSMISSADTSSVAEGVSILKGSTIQKIVPSIKKRVVTKSYSVQDYHQALREYLIGTYVLNPLRSATPCFVNTITTIRSKDDPHKLTTIYEEVPGETLTTLLHEGMSFSHWLQAFTQILISLELAQRRTGFTHYDLHTSNIIIRTDRQKGYSVSLDNLTYSIQSDTLVPVIIDLGTCSTIVDGRFIGTYNYPNSGIFHFIVPGQDMYKFLVSSYFNSTNTRTTQDILRVFSFFGSSDPYDVTQCKKQGLIKARKEFCKAIPFSEVASFTPMMMLEYLYSQFSSVLTPAIRIFPRRTRAILSSLGGNEDYTTVVESGEGLLESHSGYVMTSYALQIITIHCLDQKMREKGMRMRETLEEVKSEMIAVDIKTLDSLFEISTPSQKALSSTRKTLLGIPIRHRDASLKEKYIRQLDKLLEYQRALLPFIDVYFTILELDLEKDYDLWLKSFKSSKVYAFFMHNKVKNDRARRWGVTLSASIFSNQKPVYNY